MTSAKIIVCSLDILEKVVSDNSARHLVSLINEQMMPQTPRSVDQNSHLKLPMNDIEAPTSGLVTPSNRHVEQLIDFTVRWDQQSPLVIHCWAGISRSTAAAFIALCALNPQIEEQQIARLMRDMSATATPNPLLVSCADQVLGRSGQMIAAIEAMSRGDVAMEAAPFSMPALISPNDLTAT